MEVWINYAASVVFACIGLALMGIYAITVSDVVALKVIVISVGFAWIACTLGAAYYATGEAWLRVLAMTMNIVAVLLAVMVVFVRL